jgi:cytochrome oxidase Cu insertion factor (SCO1/SenC/PrrC family)
MRRLALAMLLSVLAVTAWAGLLAADPLETLLADLQLSSLAGRTPPPLALETLDGDTVALAGLRGRPVLLYFWASW